MPVLMSLEGPKLSKPTLLGGQLYNAMPRPVKQATVELQGVFTPFQTHGGWVIAGLLVGMWLAGTSKGQALTRKARGSKGRR